MLATGLAGVPADPGLAALQAGGRRFDPGWFQVEIAVNWLVLFLRAQAPRRLVQRLGIMIGHHLSAESLASACPTGSPRHTSWDPALYDGAS